MSCPYCGQTGIHTCKRSKMTKEEKIREFNERHNDEDSEVAFRICSKGRKNKYYYLAYTDWDQEMHFYGAELANFINILTEAKEIMEASDD